MKSFNTASVSLQNIAPMNRDISVKIRMQYLCDCIIFSHKFPHQ